MIDERKLNSALALIGKSKTEYAAFLGISRSSLARKMREESPFTLDEVQKSASSEWFGKEIARDIFLV